MFPVEASQLDRTSFVPLYYQLQEVLKEYIESGGWTTGDALPSEPELARHFGISRVVVRQALAILEDDRQIVRIRGRGTFVAPPKRNSRACGLSRLLGSMGGSDGSILVLDICTPSVERSIRERIGAAEDEEILRVTTLLSLDRTPLAISYSFFRREEVSWLEQTLHVGRQVPQVMLAEHGVALERSQVSIETTQCGQFEADRFGIPHRTPVFLVLCTEYRETSTGPRPFEVARVEYRGDIVRLRLEANAQQPGELEAIVAPVQPGR